VAISRLGNAFLIRTRSRTLEAVEPFKRCSNRDVIRVRELNFGILELPVFSLNQIRLAEQILQTCATRGFRLTAAESCTGGLIAACLTEIPGSSSVIDRTFVVYSNEAKIEVLGIPREIIVSHGAVSEPTARAMAEGALSRAHVDLSVAVTGIAGPGGGTADKPVGRVHIAAARRGFATLHEMWDFSGDRHAIRMETVSAALSALKRILKA